MLLLAQHHHQLLQTCRYSKYDAPMDKRRQTKGDDAFGEELDALEAQVADLTKVRGWLWRCSRHAAGYVATLCVCAGLSRMTGPPGRLSWSRVAAPCAQQAEENTSEKNRAIVAARNADIRCGPLLL